MKLTHGLSLLSTLSAVLAAPISEKALEERQLVCLLPQLTQLQAEQIVQRYADIIAIKPSDLGSVVQTADAIIASNYQEQSDSANIQLGIPLGAVTTPSKQVFITDSQQGPAVPTKTLSVNVAGCSNIIWQWRSTGFGNGKYQVQGFHLFELDALNQISRTYFEFNSIAGALDIGYKVINQNGVALNPNNV